MSKRTTHSSDWQANTVRNTIHLGFWTLGWVVTMAIATFGPRFLWDSNKSITIAAILLNIAIGAIIGRWPDFGTRLLEPGCDECHRS